MSKELMSPGTYLQEQISQKTREVAARHNDAGLVAMWPEAVKEVLVKFPGLSHAEKTILHGNIKDQVRLLCTRTGSSPHLFAPALQEVARLLSQ